MRLDRVGYVGCAGLVVVLLCGYPSAAHAQTRDTVVIVQRDTVYIQQEPQDRDDRHRRPMSRLEERREMLRERRELREERKWQRLERFDTLSDMRIESGLWAYYFYPSRLLGDDFPAVSVGAVYNPTPDWAVSASLGFLVDPAWRFSNWDVGRARYGVRGLGLEVGARAYLSPRNDPSPFYLAAGLEGAFAPVEFDDYRTTGAEPFGRFGTYEATGRRIGASLQLGWEQRWTSGFALDVALGFAGGAQGVTTEGRHVAPPFRDLQWDDGRGDFQNPGGDDDLLGYFYPTVRIGVGFGKWNTQGIGKIPKRPRRNRRP